MYRALLSPVRMELFEFLRFLGPCSVAELAVATGRPADGLYPHLRRMMTAGVVVEAGLRRAGRNAERLFDLVADDVAPDLKARRDHDKLFAAFFRAFQRQARRVVRDALAAGVLATDEQGRRNHYLFSDLAWLTPDDFARVREKVVELRAILDEGRRRRDGALYLWTSMALPLVRTHRPRKGRPTAKPAAGEAAARPARKRKRKPVAAEPNE